MSVDLESPLTMTSVEETAKKFSCSACKRPTIFLSCTIQCFLAREISPIIQAPTTLTTMATIHENLIDQDMYSSDCSSSRALTPSIVEQQLSTYYQLKKVA
ncbi:hypothetical protein NPIL_269951 [Nephila pilipes]|uniref:Uncharacterized protein n=1 Tax=Nephila pilipes TaxID=299642 RepID=A0A8X6QFU6_NEPPI|nr:hypothetical protein NPIL_269951 [Nephila pilipes]